TRKSPAEKVETHNVYDKGAAAKQTVAKQTVAKKAVGKMAVAKKAAKKVRVPVEEMQTEDLWALYQKARKGGEKTAPQLEQLRNILMERHYPLVKYIAERLLQTLPKSIELDDLVSAGLFGLMDAIRGFDPSRGIKFKTYCTTRIRGSILDQLRSQDWVPRLVRLKAGRIEKTLQKLTGQHIQGLYAAMMNNGLSNRTVLHCHRVLKGALRRAVTWEVLTRNPADTVSPPRPQDKNLQTWDVDTFNAFLEAAKESPYLSMYKLAALTGMRRGELCGLKWDMVDLDAGHLRVTKTLQHIDGQGLVEGQPKTHRSRRTISLSAGAMDVLRGVRADQAEQRLSIGEVWRGTGYVFVTPIGTPIGGERVSKDFARIVKGSGLPYLTFHGLRHTAASLMIAGGVHARTIADILGHSSITITMDVYGHLLKGVQEEAVNILDGQLSGTL
ncbi:MAG: sigma-70 family RNA polymerase sigma factor, partial [Chloroflexi bacterium]|nr:sigma-70 family RNA polymerase sigma factor [Chloroflexota bacterium]